MPSIFERPPPVWTRTGALNDEQEARARALLIAAEASPGLNIGEQIAMAEYITGGPAGFVVFDRMLHQPDEDFIEIKDGNGRTILNTGSTSDPWAEPVPKDGDDG